MLRRRTPVPSWFYILVLHISFLLSHTHRHKLEFSIHKYLHATLTFQSTRGILWFTALSASCKFLLLMFLSPLLLPLHTSLFSLSPAFCLSSSLSIHPALLGCSHKKSGSSSDDSDCDISPWLSSAPSSSGPSPSHSQTPKSPAQATLVVGKRSIQLHDCDDAGMF